MSNKVGVEDKQGPPGYGEPPPAYDQSIQGSPGQPSVAYAQPTPGPAGYVAPMPYATVATVQIQPGQPAPGSTHRYGDYPAKIVCQHCGATVTTRIEKKSGLATWVICGGVCIVGCWMGCCLIPFCVDGCKDTVHYCPNCNMMCGRRNVF